MKRSNLAIAGALVAGIAAPFAANADEGASTVNDGARILEALKEDAQEAFERKLQEIRDRRNAFVQRLCDDFNEQVAAPLNALGLSVEIRGEMGTSSRDQCELMVGDQLVYLYNHVDAVRQEMGQEPYLSDEKIANWILELLNDEDREKVIWMRLPEPAAPAPSQ